MPIYRVNDLDLHYETAGEGAPLLLLHGLGSSSADWALQGPVFAQRYHVIAVDLRGHGRSPSGPLRYRVEQLAEDMAALLAHLGQPPAHVVGLSLGAATALPLAARHPDRVRSLVLVNGFARLQPDGWRGAARLLKRVWLFGTAPMPVVAQYVALGLFPKPDQHALYLEAVSRLGRNRKRSYLAGMLAVVAFDARRELGRLPGPTLVVAGDRDTTVPRSAAEELHRGIGGSRLVIIEDSGHATPIDQPEVFNRLVLDFLAGVEASRPT